MTSGKGLIGVHSATDTYHKLERLQQDDGRHLCRASVAHQGPHQEPGAEERRSTPRSTAWRILKSPTKSTSSAPTPPCRPNASSCSASTPRRWTSAGGNRKDGLYPVSWISTFGKGRTFYCSLGHQRTDLLESDGSEALPGRHPVCSGRSACRCHADCRRAGSKVKIAVYEFEGRIGPGRTVRPFCRSRLPGGTCSRHR